MLLQHNDLIICSHLSLFCAHEKQRQLKDDKGYHVMGQLRKRNPELEFDILIPAFSEAKKWFNLQAKRKKQT